MTRHCQAPLLPLLIRSRFGQNPRVNQTGPTSQRARLKLAVRGAVQGVGFRPFVFRLATELGLAGWVNNSPQGVFIEVEGPRAELEKFLLRLETEKAPAQFHPKSRSFVARHRWLHGI